MQPYHVSGDNALVYRDIRRLFSNYVEAARRHQSPLTIRAANFQEAADAVERSIRRSFRVHGSARDIASGFDIEMSVLCYWPGAQEIDAICCRTNDSHTHGEGVARAVITHLAQQRFSGPSSVLQSGYNEQLYWQPRVIVMHIALSSSQEEDAFYEGALLILQIIFCCTFPIGLALPSVVYHLSGSVHSFTREAAEAWMPNIASAIDAHRDGNITQFSQLCLNHLNMPVRLSFCCIIPPSLSSLLFVSFHFCDYLDEKWRLSDNVF
jgi:hypothetical protein